MTMSNIYDEFFCENNLSLKAAIFAKISITDVLRRSKYACMNDTRKNKLNIHVCYTNTGEIIWCVTEKKPFASINNSFDKNSFWYSILGFEFYQMATDNYHIFTNGNNSSIYDRHK